MGDGIRQRGMALLRWVIPIAVPCLLFWTGLLSSTARAAETHTFDATLSLTGGCSTSSLDPIADPGCPEGVHPESPFAAPNDVITDAHGDMFVSTWGNVAAGGAEGAIDIFSPSGVFLAEVSDSRGPQSIAVDSVGNLYVVNHRVGNFENQLVRYAPTIFNPVSGEIKYTSGPIVIDEGGTLPEGGLAINPLNDHLFVHFGSSISEFSSAAEGNELLDKTIGSGTLFHGMSVAVDAVHGRLYASDSEPSLQHSKIRIFELSSPHKLLDTFNGSTAPKGAFLSQSGLLSVAVDEKTGHFSVYDANAPEPVVYEFAENDEYVSTISQKFKEVANAKIGIANGSTNLNRGYLFVPSNESGIGHSYAFAPITKCAPEIQSLTLEGITETEAEAQAEINPCGAETTYTFEYTTLERFESEGFAGAAVAGQGEIAVSNEAVEVNAPLIGLSPGTAYRIRVVASNSVGSNEAESGFRTYAIETKSSCPNDSLRAGLSAFLPDCRAYELVTPADTNGKEPVGVGLLGAYFTTLQASPSGGKVSFRTEGGTIPGFEGTGHLGGDPYLATRGGEGWSTSSAGPTGAEAVGLTLGGISSDQGYSFWGAGGGGTAYLEGETNYVRYPDGHSQLLGEGDIGTDREARGKLISPNGEHIVFASNVPLAEDSPPANLQAVYDRTADGVVHVVSLLPDENAPANEDAIYRGASIDGSGIAFSIGSTLYLRLDNAVTYELGENIVFAGVSQNGKRVFYIEEGDLWSFDTENEERTRFTAAGDINVVNIAPSGNRAYFVSSVALPELENPSGAVPQGGKQNLYMSEEGTISFVGTVTQRDVEGAGKNDKVDGLGRWVAAISLGDGLGGLGADPSRTTPDGSILIFESRADLTGYDSEGHAEIYRYDSAEHELTCLSCNPTEVPAQGEASFESIIQGLGDPEPFSSAALVANLRSDGRRVFFQSTESLVPRDTDGLQDVYEWEEQGVGSCTRVGGCIYLISSGHSLRNDYLFAVSENGDDVFFRTGDLLLGSDTEATPSIYDARANGGFPEKSRRPCEGEGCRPDLTSPPAIPEPESAAQGPPDVVPSKSCPKGKHEALRKGKKVCVKKKRHHRRHHAAKGAGK